MSVVKDILKLQGDGKRIGVTFSTFDLLHAGHCLMLADCLDYCDVLVVGLQSDPTLDRPDKSSPVQSMFERWIQLESNRNVDFIIPYSTEHDVEDILYTLMPDCRIIGEEYEHQGFTGKDIVGIELIYNSRFHSFSTTSLRQRVLDA